MTHVKLVQELLIDVCANVQQRIAEPEQAAHQSGHLGSQRRMVMPNKDEAATASRLCKNVLCDTRALQFPLFPASKQTTF